MSLSGLSQTERSDLVVSLALLLCSDAGVDPSGETLQAVIDASGNKIASYYATLFSQYTEKTGGVKHFLGGPSAGLLCVCLVIYMNSCTVDAMYMYYA
jgi:hypothetical protein